MNRRFYCAVGLASGVILLGGGVAQAGTGTTETERMPGNETLGHGQDELPPSAAGSLARLGHDPAAGRNELLPGLGGNSGADGLSALFDALPGGKLLGEVTTGRGPLGELMRDGLATLMGGMKPATDGDSPDGVVSADPPAVDDPAAPGDAGVPHGQPADAMGAQTAHTAPSEPAGRRADRDQRTSHRLDGVTAHGGTARGEAVTRGGEVLPEHKGPIDRKLSIGSVLDGNNLSLVGSDTFKALPLIGGLLGDGIGLRTLRQLPIAGDLITQLGGQNTGHDTGKASPMLGTLPIIGTADNATADEESAGAHDRAFAWRAIDKANVAPRLLTPFDADPVPGQAAGTVTHQLPLAGELHDYQLTR